MIHLLRQCIHFSHQKIPVIIRKDTSAFSLRMKVRTLDGAAVHLRAQGNGSEKELCHILENAELVSKNRSCILRHTSYE